MPGRLIFVNRFYRPDHSATAQILGDVAEFLAGRGFQIIVITSRLSYDGDRALPRRETINGVQVVRVATSNFGRSNLLGRALDYATFYISAFLSALLRVRNSDCVIAKTDPPMISVPIAIAARFKGASHANWLQDLYPEVAREIGVSLARGPIGAVLTHLRNLSLRSARATIVIGRLMGEKVAAIGVPADRIVRVHNFVDDEDITPICGGDTALRTEWGFSPEDVVVGYSGNLGRAHDVDTILNAAARLQSDPQIKFLFVGGGQLRSTVEDQISKRGLSNIVLQPYQPRSELPHALSVPDIHWLSLKPELEGLIVPSKTYGVAAAGRPLIVIGAIDGEVGEIVRRHAFGAVVPTGDDAGLAAIISSLAMSLEIKRAMGRNARRFIEHEGSKRLALEQWQHVAAFLTSDTARACGFSQPR